MKSKEEIIRLLWTFLGAVAGVAVGFSLMTLLFSRVPTLSQSPTILPLIVVLFFCGGGLIGGGYLTLLILSKRQKAERRKYFAEKKKQKKGRR